MLLRPFSKYEGCGNDFILMDNRQPSYLNLKKEKIVQLCHRQLGIGADGLILLEDSVTADFRMRIFNADGGETEMCGNGIRCLIKFIVELGLSLTSYQIETMHRTLSCTLKEDSIAIAMGNPIDIQLGLQLTIDKTEFTVHHINTGVPHLVLFVTDAKNFPLSDLGPKFRHHPHFPKGVNFNVATVLPEGDCIFNRTFERGVENETLACGTGCTAVALVSTLLKMTNPPVKVKTHADILEITFDIENSKPVNVTMTGPATKTFSGYVNINAQSDTFNCIEDIIAAYSN